MKRNLFAFLLFLLVCSCSDNGNPQFINKDFSISLTAENESKTLVGKPIRVSVRVSDLDKNNPDEIRTFLNSNSGTFSFNEKTVLSGDFFNNDYRKENRVSFDYTPTTDGTHEVTVEAKSKTVTRKETILINVSSPVIDAVMKDIEKFFLVNSTNTFILHLNEAENLTDIKATAKFIKGNASLLISGASVMDAGDNGIPLKFGDNTITFTPSVIGENTIEFTLSGRYGSPKVVSVTLNVVSPDWNASLVQFTDPLIIGKEYSTLISLTQTNGTETKYSGVYRYEEGPADGIFFNGAGIMSANKFDFKLGESILVVKPETPGNKKVEFTISDIYGKQEKLILTYTVSKALSPIDAKLNIVEIKSEISKLNVFLLTVSEEDYNNGFTLKYSSESLGTFLVNSVPLGNNQITDINKGVTTLSFVANELGTSVISLIVSDNNNQTKNLNILVSAYAEIRTVSNLSLGSTSGDNDFYNKNETATVKAIPNAGSLFTGWFENNVLVSSNANYSFTVIKSRSLEARFSLIYYDIILTSTSGGGATGTKSYTYGQNATVTATPLYGYSFTGWFENNVLISSNATYSFAVAKSVNLEARFSPIDYDINAFCDGGTVTGNKKYAYNTQAVLNASPDSYHTFSGWYEDNILVSSNVNYSFTVTKSRNLEARFLSKIIVNIAALFTNNTPLTGGVVFKFLKLEFTFDFYIMQNGKIIPYTSDENINITFVANLSRYMRDEKNEQFTNRRVTVNTTGGTFVYNLPLETNSFYTGYWETLSKINSVSDLKITPLQNSREMVIIFPKFIFVHHKITTGTGAVIQYSVDFK